MSEWFAVKRTKASKNYEFYCPNKRNREIIEQIAPNGGNFEVIELVEKSELTALKAKYQKAVECINWYASWDWSDKYVQAVPKKARQTLAELGEKE